MEPIQPPAKRTHIVVVGLCIVALLVITVSLGGGCRQEPPRGQQVAPGPPPTPKPTDAPPGDTPIIVKGGGSIDLDFDSTIFSGSPPSCTNCLIETVELEQIKETGQPIPPSPILTGCTLPANPIVTIETQGNSDNVTVTGTANTVKIDFPAAKYPGVINACGEPKKFHAKDGEIKKVKVNGTECGGCEGNSKRCKVTITVKRI